MSVASRNPFALLDSEAASRPTTPPQTKDTSSAPPVPTRNQQKTKGGPASRGGKYYARGGAAKATPRDANPNGIDETPADGQKRFEGGDARGRGRGRGASRGGPRGRGRQFDRHSATGKTDSEKKIHQSWGGDDGKTELKVQQAASTDAAAEGAWGGDAQTGDWNAPAAESTQDWGNADSATPADGTAADKPEGERRRKDREPEEEDNTLTLEQYLAQKKDSSGIPKLSTRKANDGAGEDIWKGVVPLQKNPDENDYFVGKSKSSAPKARSAKPDKVFLEIDARFDRPDRGGRGRGRGDRSRGRGAPRSGRPAAHQPVNVHDQAAFPSLA